MQKTELIKRFVLLITLLNLASCRVSNPFQSSTPPPNANNVTSTNVTSTEEADVSLNWFMDSQLKPTDTVSAVKAKAFIRNVYQTIDDRIFDPAFKKTEQNQTARSFRFCRKNFNEPYHSLVFATQPQFLPNT